MLKDVPKDRPGARRLFKPEAAILTGTLLLTATLLASSAPADSSPITPRRLIRNLEAKSFSGERVELRLDGAGLAEILARFEETSGLKFNIDPSVMAADWARKQYNFLGVPWDKALDSILFENGLELRLKGEALWVQKYAPPKDKRVSAFLIGALTAGVLAGGILLALARKRRRRRMTERERKITLEETAVAEVVERLNYLFRVERIHRNGRLSLDSLAERLGLQPYQLSGIVNSRLGRTFTDLVADFRIEEVKKRLADPKETANILNIAYDAGFGTKASFNRIFKERTGRTPTEFKKKGQKPNGA